MKCSNCGTKKKLIEKAYVFDSLLVGETVHKICFEVCPSCGHETIPASELIKVNQTVNVIEKKAVSKLPIGGFISLNEANKMLGVTKQAFSKNSRIKNGFIISHTIERRKYFYRPSVQLFKETNDGRFNIKVRYASEIQYQAAESLYFLIKPTKTNDFVFKNVSDEQVIHSYEDLANEFFTGETSYGYE